MKQWIRALVVASIGGLASTASFSQAVFITEQMNQLRVEQYTGPAGGIALWRLPTPGVTTFPDSPCLSVRIPTDAPEHASRFMALYLQAKASGRTMFYVFNKSTCMLLSFGMDG